MRMVYMTDFVETFDKKLFNTFPLPTSDIAHFIRIDTTIFQNLFLGSRPHTANRALKFSAWETCFKLDHSAFHLHVLRAEDDYHLIIGEDTRNPRNYVFDYQIMTDGITAVVLLVRSDLANVLFYQRDSMNPTRNVEIPEMYVDDLNEDQKAWCRLRKIVGIDPGMSDLLYCVDHRKRKKQKRARYTQNSRSRHTCQGKNKRKR